MPKKNHRARRSQAQLQSRWIMGGAALVVIAAALFLILSNSGEALPEVVDERLTLDPVLGNPDAPVTVIE